MLDGHICLSGPISSSLESTAGERTRCEARQEGEARRGKSSRPRRTRSIISASRRSLVDLRSILGQRRRRRIEQPCECIGGLGDRVGGGEAKRSVGSGGIVGMGETRRTRAALIAQLANLNPYPESVPINNLVQVEGTPLHGTAALDPLEFVRTIAAARITMPKAMVRLSAGRQEMSEGIQALCFLAGANSIFYGDKLLTTGNPEAERDRALMDRLGMRPMTREARGETARGHVGREA